MTKFYRSTKDKKLGGICGGLGEIYNIDSNLLRIIFTTLFVVTGFFPFAIIYAVAWIILPEDVSLNE